MQNELTCNQVIALMSFYVEDKLKSKLKEYVDEHLKKCPKCREIYMQSKKIAAHVLSLTEENSDDNPYYTKQYEIFRNNLSAYVDNELNEQESIRIKKIAISNPLARKDLEDMYSFKRMLHNSFDKTRSDWKNDYSKIIINKIDSSIKRKDPFIKIIAIFGAMMSLIIIGFIAILYL